MSTAALCDRTATNEATGLLHVTAASSTDAAGRPDGLPDGAAAERMGLRTTPQLADSARRSAGLTAADRAQRAARWERAGCWTALTILVGVLLIVAVRRTGHDPFIDVPVPAERSAAVRIDLNTAAWYDLLLLDGVGETLARRIVEDRAANGPLATVDDLARVPGIGPGKLQAIREQATVSGASVVLGDRTIPPPPLTAE